MKRLLILGAGGYGATVADVAEQLGIYDQICFLDDGQTDPSILGTCEQYPQFLDGNTVILPAFGNNAIRAVWVSRLTDEGVCAPSLVHPRAYVSPTARIGRGTVILPMAVVGTNTVIGDGCIVNLGAILDHNSILENGVHLAPGAVVKACNQIPALQKVESGTVIENNVYPVK